MLVDDFDEFRSMVEAPLARLKMKKFVKQRIGNSCITAERNLSNQVYFILPTTIELVATQSVCCKFRLKLEWQAGIQAVWTSIFRMKVGP